MVAKNQEEVKMSPLSSEQLKKQINTLPTELQKALEKQAKARIVVARLEAQISKLESEIGKEDEQDDNDSLPEYNDIKDNRELLKMEFAVERLKLKVTEAEDKAEMAFRKTTEKLQKH